MQYIYTPLHSCEYLEKISIKINVANDEGNSRNKTWPEQTMKLEWKAGSEWNLNSWPEPVG